MDRGSCYIEHAYSGALAMTMIRLQDPTMWSSLFPDPQPFQKESTPWLRWWPLYYAVLKKFSAFSKGLFV